MAITSYSSLKTEIADWLERDDISNAIDTMIDLVEADLYRDLRVVDMESTLSVAISSGAMTLPSDWLEAKFIYIDGSPVSPLEFRSSDWLVREYPTRSSSGKPVFCAISGSTLIFGPYPDSNYTVSGIYYARPTALSTSNETNFLITKHPDVLLYGALAHSAGYIGDDPRMPMWQALYEKAKSGIAVEDNRERFPRRTALRVSPQ